VLQTPEQSTPDAEKPPEEPEECPTGFHWSDEEEQCVPDEVGDSDATPMVALTEQEVPAAVNAPSTVAKDDAATCPEGQHWDDEAGKCVDDVTEECEAGWHFDVALMKCVPDNPQVNEKKTVSDLRLENAKLRVDLIHTNDKLKEHITTIHGKTRAIAGKNLEIAKYLQANATLEGRITEKQGEVRKLEAQITRLNKEARDYMRRTHNLDRDVEDKNEKITRLQENLEKLTKSRNNVLTENQRLVEENLKLSSDLTDVRNEEVQWNRDKKDLQEGLAKALKHQKYVYEFLKSKGFEAVNT